MNIFLQTVNSICFQHEQSGISGWRIGEVSRITIIGKEIEDSS